MGHSDVGQRSGDRRRGTASGAGQSRRRHPCFPESGCDKAKTGGKKGRHKIQGDRDRFEGKFIPEPNSGCFLWLGKPQQRGYGQFTLGGTTKTAHRVAYEMYIGDVPDGMDVDHLCRNRLCVNTAHLEVVSHAENLRRALPFRRAAK